MSYNPDTGHVRCDVCGLEHPVQRYYTYLRVGSNVVRHICLTCKASGAYWCQDCQDRHRLPGTCPQRRLPLDGPEASDG
jgi:hypothetical protein